MKKLFFSLSLLFFFGLSLFFTNCANRIPPTGGRKDSLAPKIRTSIPENQSINFKGTMVVLLFDEWIKEENLKKELVITPAIEDYKYKIIKKKLILTFPEPLQENTTYSFNFRKGVKDITEGNITPNLKTAFSTGDFLDSMRLGGNVTDLQSNAPLKEVLISLYKPDDTLTVGKHKPYYFTFTDEAGNYEISNVKKGNYLVYAFEDKNGSLTYQEGEKIAFLTQPLSLTDENLDTLGLQLMREDHKVPKITRRSKEKHYFLLGFNEGLAKLEIYDNSIPKEPIPFSIDDLGKNIKLYNLKNQYDSIPLEIVAEDSSGNQLKEVINIKFEEILENKKNDPFTATIKLKAENGIEKNVQFDIKFTKPVQTADLSKIIFIKDSNRKLGDFSWAEQIYLTAQNKGIEKYPLLGSSKTYKWNENKTMLTIDTNISFKETINIVIEPNTFISIEEDSSKVVDEIYPLKDVKKLGTISGVVETKEKSNYILQLLNESQLVVREIKNAKKFEFDYLAAGSYTLRAIIDTNNNGKWDGSYMEKNQLGEEIILYKQAMKLREGWDIQGEVFQF